MSAAGRTNKLIKEIEAKAARYVTKENHRYYKIPGADRDFPSVTTVLGIVHKPSLFNWQINSFTQSVVESLQTLPQIIQSLTAATTIDSPPKPPKSEEVIKQIINESKARTKKVVDTSVNIGVTAHAVIDDNVLKPKGEKIKKEAIKAMPAEVQPIVSAFDLWRAKAGLTFERKDSFVYSLSHRYAGAVDAVARHDDGHLIAIDWKTSNGFYGTQALQVSAYCKALEEMFGEPIKEAWIVKFDKTNPDFETKRVHDIEESFEAFLGALHLYNYMNHKTYFIDLHSSKPVSNDSFFKNKDKSQSYSTKTNNTKSKVSVDITTESSLNKSMAIQTASSLVSEIQISSTPNVNDNENDKQEMNEHENLLENIKNYKSKCSYLIKDTPSGQSTPKIVVTNKNTQKI
ncbi:hypothetical protein CYY_002280 [Polysphondylium violaceum]|uniref:PD-(D/E)XK endonuclease-like domain-containing protein n=1 Tax=Polysphondylium violaceum TaxID=133409 RepID=A0A8J4V318_9MYCE|nr:hypothetical protein CYY_002280 [Polysphondylium violaceum]